MNVKTIMNLGLLSGAMFFASCGNTSNEDESTEINALAELEDQAFQQEVSEEEERLENYIKEISPKIEAANDEDLESLKTAKIEAVNMLLELRADYINLTDETAAKWVVFQEGINNLVKSAEEEINYAQDLDEDSSDS